MKILYVSREYGKQTTGGEYVKRRNLELLYEIAGNENVDCIFLPRFTLMTLGLSLLCKSSYGVSRKIEKQVLKKARSTHYDLVFVEGVLLGGVIKRLRQHHIQTVAFAHNVETALAKQEISVKHSLLANLRFRLVSLNEAKTIRNTSYLIVLNDRDNEGFISRYQRRADVILPISCPIPCSNTSCKALGFKPYLLFVGSDFFPNIEGINWFIDKVSPFIPYDLRIVGGCCDNPALRNRNLPDNVYLEGYVTDLSVYYREALAVVAPIFHGSGMKTKTIEALSYGKTILGTDEAFVGIAGEHSKLGGVCNTAKDFIESIDSLDIRCLSNIDSLQIYQDNYTDDICRQKMQSFLYRIIEVG